MVTDPHAASWNRRSRKDARGGTGDIGSYSVRELLGVVHGLRFVLIDISESANLSEEDVRDLLFVSGRLALVSVELETRMRSSMDV